MKACLDRLQDDGDRPPVARAAGLLCGPALQLLPELAEVLGDAHGIGGGTGEAAACEADGVEPKLALPAVGELRLWVAVLAEEVRCPEPLWHIASVAGGEDDSVDMDGGAIGEHGVGAREAGDAGDDGDLAAPDPGECAGVEHRGAAARVLERERADSRAVDAELVEVAEDEPGEEDRSFSLVWETFGSL